jgi:hypothetical protein
VMHNGRAQSRAPGASFTRCSMKSYWSVAALVLVSVWPSSSQAYVAGIGQISADEKPVQQAPSANPSPTSPNPATSHAPSGARNSGSYLLVELSKTLKANKLKPGDKIKAEVSQDVIAHGKVIIPAETEVVGHVTEVNSRDTNNQESRLGIVFDRILLKHFHDVSFQAVVQTVSPPVMRRSRVDEPSQMLPPSMIVGDLRGPSPNTMARSNGGRAAPPPAPSGASEANAGTTLQAPLTVKESPSTHTATGASAATLETNASGHPLSVGMPQGVFGLKGLSLTPGTTSSTPGPVIVSNTKNVKLESGTQILLHVLSVSTPQAKN